MITNNKPPKCPVCKNNEECIEFAFIANHYSDLDNNQQKTPIVDYNNPSDFNRLYMCPENHIYDETGEMAFEAIYEKGGELIDKEQKKSESFEDLSKSGL